MPILIAVLCLLTLASAVSTIVLRRHGRSFDGMLFKFLSSFGFMSTAFLGFCYNSDSDAVYFCLTVFGLMFGLAGDILLGLKEIAPNFKKRLILMGTVAFLIGHIFVISAFFRRSGFYWLAPVIALAGGVLAFILLKGFKFKVDTKMLIILSVYYMVLWLKLAMAVCAYIKSSDPAFIVAIVSCVLFIVSDTCLGFLYFTPVKAKNKLVTAELSSYYPAQILIALTVALIR